MKLKEKKKKKNFPKPRFCPATVTAEPQLETPSRFNMKINMKTSNPFCWDRFVFILYWKTFSVAFVHLQLLSHRKARRSQKKDFFSLLELVFLVIPRSRNRSCHLWFFISGKFLLNSSLFNPVFSIYSLCFLTFLFRFLWKIENVDWWKFSSNQCSMSSCDLLLFKLILHF